jgi:PadR family transcriptional regulator, regulatory protein PadR
MEGNGVKAWITQLRKGLLDYVVLTALAHGESYGYQLVGRLKELEDLEITESTIYPILNRLRSDGYVKVREVASADGPARRYYSLTTVGQYRAGAMNEYWESVCLSLRRLRQGCEAKGCETKGQDEHDAEQDRGSGREGILRVGHPSPGKRVGG